MSFHVIYMNYFCTVIYIIIIPYLGGGVSDSWLDVRKRGGGSFRCILCATGGVGGLKFGKKCVRN